MQMIRIFVHVSAYDVVLPFVIEAFVQKNSMTDERHRCFFL